MFSISIHQPYRVGFTPADPSSQPITSPALPFPAHGAAVPSVSLHLTDSLVPQSAHVFPAPGLQANQASSAALADRDLGLNASCGELDTRVCTTPDGAGKTIISHHPLKFLHPTTSQQQHNPV